MQEEFITINNSHYGVNEDYGFLGWFEMVLGDLF